MIALAVATLALAVAVLAYRYRREVTRRRNGYRPDAGWWL